MLTRARAALDASGTIVDWQYEVWSNTHSTRPAGAGQAAAGAAPAPRRSSRRRRKPLPQPEGGGDRNAIPLYALPNARVVHHFVPDMPLRVSALRALGAYMNVFSIESFMDELAAAAGADPVAFRLRHLEDARARDGGRPRRPSGSAGRDAAMPRGRGRGLRLRPLQESRRLCGDCGRGGGRARERARAPACARSRRSTAGRPSTRTASATRSRAASFSRPAGRSTSRSTFDRTRITSRDWSSYPILRFVAVPESVDVHVIDRPGQPFLGTGEAAQGPAAAAIANAVAACDRRPDAGTAANAGADPNGRRDLSSRREE